MDYGDVTELPRRTGSEKELHDKEFSITKNSKQGAYQGKLVTMVHKLFDKMSATHKGTGINSDVVSNNQQLAKELHKPIIRKY